MGQATSAALLPCMSQEQEAQRPLPTLLVARGEPTAAGGKAAQKIRGVDEQEITVRVVAGRGQESREVELEESLFQAMAGFSGSAPPPPPLGEPVGEPAAAARPEPRLPLPPTTTMLPQTLCHGPRELAHMRHLGLIKSGEALQGDGQSAACSAPARLEESAGAAASGDPDAPSAAAAPEEAPRAEDSEARRERKRRHRSKALKKKARAEVQPFLESHGFKGVKAQRRWLFRTSYPLHAAVRESDASVVRQLLLARANPSKQDSAGRTPLDLAEEKNRRSSHSDVIALLTQPRSSLHLGSSGSAIH